MSGQKIKLSIFNPLGQYFSLLYATCNTFDANCIDKNFMGIITNQCDEDGKGETGVSENFKNALKLFAYNLKTFDYPISHVTIKGKLYNLLNDILFKRVEETKSFEGAKYKLTFKINKDAIINAIKTQYKILLSWGLNINEKYSKDGEKTYLEKLMEILETNVERFKEEQDTDFKTEEIPEIKKAILLEVFNFWLHECFNVYKNSQERFNEFLNELNESYKSSNKEFDTAHIAAFNKFFQIVDAKTGSPIELSGSKGFWKNVMNKLSTGSPDDNKLDGFKNKYRINIKVVKSYEQLEEGKYVKLDPMDDSANIQAGICYALPASERKFFNQLLVKYNQFEDGELLKEKNFYKIKKDCEKGSYKLDETQIKKLFDFVKTKSAVTKITSDEKWVPDVHDTLPYFDGSDSFVIDDAYKYIEKYKNTWVKDTNNNFYTKLDENNNIKNKWTLYDDEKFKKDVESFKTKSGNCGHLCMFDEPDKCNDFFQKITTGDKNVFDTLSEMINKNGFKENYQKLKENIVKVNPAFVVLTLKAFKFHRWEKFNSDGTKIVRVESFSRWWNRMGKEFMYKKDVNGNLTTELKDGIDKDYNKHSHTDDEYEEMLVPVPPENLELFLKLLISFINYNEFVINPQRKDSIINNRLPITTVYPQSNGQNPEFFKIKKGNKIVEVRNAAYKSNKNSNESEELENLLDNLKKFHKPPTITDENKPILSALMGLTYAINPNGKFTFSRTHPFSTGVGYVAFGGGEPKPTPEAYKKCALTAFETFQTILNKLQKKNIVLNENDRIKIFNEIAELSKLEQKLYENLKIIGVYETMKDALDLSDAEDKTIFEMDEYIREYESLYSTISNKTDNFTSLLFKLSNTDVKAKYLEL